MTITVMPDHYNRKVWFGQQLFLVFLEKTGKSFPGSRKKVLF